MSGSTTRWGRCWRQLSRRDEAIRFYTAARAIRPETAHELAHALEKRGESDEAIAVFRDLKRLRPGNARHLGCLGQALKAKGLSQEADEALEAAVAAGREAIRLKPDSASAHARPRHRPGESRASSTRPSPNTARRSGSSPTTPGPTLNLGNVLAIEGKLDEAIAEYREAIRILPGDGGNYSNYGRFLGDLGRHDEAIEACRKAIELDPSDAGARYNLGKSLAAKGCLRDALAAFGEAQRVDPTLSQSRRWQLLYHAARAAALAAAGGGNDEPKPDDDAKAKLREQALVWLKAELSEWTKVAATDPPGAKELIAEILEHWKTCPGFAAIHDEPELAKLPDAEQREWRVLWNDVDALLKRAEPPKASEAEPDNPEALVRIHTRAHRLAPSSPGEAEPLFRQALEGFRKAQGPDGELTLDLTIDLAGLLDRTGRGALAEPLFRDALEGARKRFGPADPRTARILAPLGLCLIRQGHWTEAEPVLREALAIREKSEPDEWTTFNTRSLLGGSLRGQKKYVEAEPLILGGYEGMKVREAKIPPPGKPRLTDAAERVVTLYEAWGKHDDAAKWRARLAKAERLGVGEPAPKLDVKSFVKGSWDLTAASAEFRKGLEDRAKRGPVGNNPRATERGREQEVARLRDAIRLKPEDGGLYSNYGRNLGYLGRHDEAIEACRQAIRLNPSDGGAHYNLGNSLAAKGRLRDALAAFREAQRVEPALSESREWQLLYHAACAAALAGSGRGQDEPPPDDPAKAKLRGEALDWLKAELATWTKLLESGPPQERPAIVRTLEQWHHHSDLAGVRDALALAEMPADEQKQWQALWAEVETLLERARGSTPVAP